MPRARLNCGGGSCRWGHETTDGAGSDAAGAEERSCTCRRARAANLQELKLRENSHRRQQCNQQHGVQLAAHTTCKPTTLTAAAAATCCSSPQRAGASKLDRRLESAGHGRARQRRNEEQRTHLFNPVTCTAEACHIRWAASLKKVLGLSTLAALAPPCTQRPGCRVEVHIARGRHDLCMAIAKNHGIRKLMSNDRGTRRSFSDCMNSMPP